MTIRGSLPPAPCLGPGGFLGSAGDGSLHLVSRLLGAEAAEVVARYMEYDNWRRKPCAAMHLVRLSSCRIEVLTYCRPEAHPYNIAPPQPALNINHWDT